MQLAPKLVLATLIINGIISGIIYLSPGLVALGLWLLIIPGLILGIMPTLFLYHFCAAVPWLYFQRRNPLLSYLLPIVAVLTVAIAVPNFQNARLDSLVQAEQSRNALPPTKPTTADSIALQSNSKAEYLHCGYLCQTFLFNKVAKEVVVNPLPGEGKPLAFRLAPNAECSLKETDRLLKHDYFLDPSQLAPILTSTHLRLAEGICILPGTPTTKPTFEVHWINQTNAPIEIRGVELVAPNQWTARATQTHAPHFFTPLYLEPKGSGITFNRWEWATRSTPRQETTILTYLAQLTNFNLALPPKPTPDDIRDHIDDLLDDPSAPSAAFLLVQDYQRVLYDGDESGDAKRIARLIADPRLSKFEILNNSRRKRVPQVIVEALIRRLTRLDNLDEGEIYNLQATAASLPKGTFANADLAPVFDNPVLARRSEKLLPRLADEGPSAAPKLLHIIEQGFTQPDTKDRLWGKEILHAASALCRLGPQASSVLPDLLLLNQRHSNLSATQSTAWLATLFALGHPLSSIPAPANWQRPQFESSLKNYVRNCSR